MTDPQDVFTELAADGDETGVTMSRIDGDQWQSSPSASGGVITPHSAQRARRGRSADLRWTSVCW